MKIVHILLTRRFAGSERYMIELANAQSACHDVTVILHRSAAEKRSDALAHRLAPEVKQIYVSGVLWWAQWQVRRTLRKLNPDVAHAHLSGACRSLKGLKLYGLRVATLHIRYKPQQHSDLDALIAIAPWQLADVPHHLLARTRQIDNWTQLQLPDRASRSRIRAELGLAESDLLIGALGRIESSKGMDLLIQAFDVVRQPGVRLVLVGAGRDWRRLRQQAARDIVMPGFVERPNEWFSAFDVFVSSARSEPFGLVLLEAMASGLPVLATRSEGAQHLESLIGRPLIACNDVTAIAAGLLEFVSQRPPRQTYNLSDHKQQVRIAEIEQWYQQAVKLPRTWASG